MSQTDIGRERIRLNDERIDRSIAERIEASAAARTPHGGVGDEEMTPASRKILERTTHNAEQRASIAARAKAARSSPVYRAAAAARAARTAARTTVPPTAFRDATSARAASQTHPHPGDASIPTPEGAKAAGEDPHAETPLEEPASAMPMDVDREIASGDTEMHFIGSMSTEQGIGRLSPPIDDEVAELLLAQMGASGRQSRRDYGRAARK